MNLITGTITALTLATFAYSQQKDYNDSDATRIDPTHDEGNVVPTTVPDLFDTAGKESDYTSTIIQSAPPAGGVVTVLHEWSARYAKNDKVGEIWILPVLAKVVINGTTEYDQVFIVYHCETQKSDVQLVFGIKPEKVEEYINTN